MRHLLTTGLLAAAVFAAPALAEDAPLDQALAHFKAGEWKLATEDAAAVKPRDADFAKAQYLVGECLLQLGKYANAEAAFDAVLEKKPEAVPALVGQGKALAAQDKDEAARDTFEKAIDADPKDATAQLALGEFLLEQDELKAAKKPLSAALKLAPKDPNASRALVTLHLRKDADKPALKVAKKLAKASPDHPMGHFLVGLVRDHDGDDDEAIEAYEKAVSKDDAFLDAHKNLAILCTAKNPLYTNKERTEKAMHHYERYFELGGQDAGLEKIYRTLKSFLDSQR